MNTEQQLMVRVLVFREGNSYIAQCLEYDIAAQGKTVPEVKAAFERTIIGQIILDRRRGKKPLEGIPAAPEAYEEMFARAMRLADEETINISEDVPPAYMVNEIRKELRVI